MQKKKRHKTATCSVALLVFWLCQRWLEVKWWGMRHTVCFRRHVSWSEIGQKPQSRQLQTLSEVRRWGKTSQHTSSHLSLSDETKHFSLQGSGQSLIPALIFTGHEVERVSRSSNRMRIVDALLVHTYSVYKWMVEPCVSDLGIRLVKYFHPSSIKDCTWTQVEQACSRQWGRNKTGKVDWFKKYLLMCEHVDITHTRHGFIAWILNWKSSTVQGCYQWVCTVFWGSVWFQIVIETKTNVR